MRWAGGVAAASQLSHVTGDVVEMWLERVGTLILRRLCIVRRAPAESRSWTGDAPFRSIRGAFLLLPSAGVALSAAWPVELKMDLYNSVSETSCRRAAPKDTPYGARLLAPRRLSSRKAISTRRHRHSIAAELQSNITVQDLTGRQTTITTKPRGTGPMQTTCASALVATAAGPKQDGGHSQCLSYFPNSIQQR